MKRKGSRIADSIMKDYRAEQSYKKRVRQKCKEQDCTKCKCEQICEDKEIKEEEIC